MVLTVLLIIIYLAFISLGLPDSLLGSAWPSMFPLMDVPISYAGIISMIIAGGTIVSSLLSDKLIRKLGTGLVTFISTLMTAAALLGFSVSKEFIELCLYAIPLGIGAGAIDAALNNFVALYYEAKHMNWLHCFWGVGAMTGPIIMSYFLERGYIYHLGYRTVAIIQFILVLILAITLPFWKKASLQSKDKSDKEKSGEIQHKVVNIKELLKMPGAKQALVAFFCYCSIEGTAGLWGSSYAVMVHGIPAETAAKWGSLFYFGITIARLLFGFATLKLTNRQMTYIGETFIAIGTLMLVLPFGSISFLIGFVMIGVGCAPIYPSMLHDTPSNFGAEYSQSIMGVQMASAYVGSTFVPPLFGVLASYLGHTLLPYFLGFFLLLMFVMIIMLNKNVDAKKQILK